MPRSASIALSESAAVGLFFMQRYRFLTINQYARVAHLNPSTARDQLLHMQRLGLLGFFGNAGLIGYGKTPKVYFLTRKGFDMLLRDCDFSLELIGPHKEVKVDSRWSPQMFHRLRTVDLMNTVVLNAAHKSLKKLPII
jgi:hypothetical protein